jgi:hypothetical protein
MSLDGGNSYCYVDDTVQRFMTQCNTSLKAALQAVVRKGFTMMAPRVRGRALP